MKELRWKSFMHSTNTTVWNTTAGHHARKLGATKNKVSKDSFWEGVGIEVEMCAWNDNKRYWRCHKWGTDMICAVMSHWIVANYRHLCLQWVKCYTLKYVICIINMKLWKFIPPFYNTCCLLLHYNGFSDACGPQGRHFNLCHAFWYQKLAQIH